MLMLHSYSTWEDAAARLYHVLKVKQHCSSHTHSLSPPPPSFQHGTGRTRYMNRNFRHRLQEFCRESFHAPPESTREKIMSASLAMLQGDWQRCRDVILGLNAWQHLRNKEGVLNKLKERIQHESVRTFLLANSGYFDTITLAMLSYANAHGLEADLRNREEAVRGR